MAKEKQAADQRLPFKDVPLRDPGQSVREQLDDLYNAQLIPGIATVGMIWAFVAYELITWWLQVDRHPAHFLPAAIGFTIYLFVKYRRLRPKIHNLKLGLLGERHVGQYLDEQLRPHGFHVIHDICEDGYNIDHIIVGPGGVYCVDTKAHTKPLKGHAAVVYDGSAVTINGMTPDRDPIAQARAARDRVREVLQKVTGRSVSVKPVVVYAGWYTRMIVRDPDVWVLNEKSLVKFIAARPRQLSTEDVALYTTRLKEHCTRDK